VDETMSDDIGTGIRVDLSEQVAVVTGASQGIGRACAIELARNGAKVACVARSAEKLADVVQVIRDEAGEAEAFTCDVSDGESVKSTVDAVVAKWGKLDILVNNAGITKDGLMVRMSDEDWDAVINTNLRGAFLFARAASILMMQARHGRIINMTSVSGLIGNKGQANYSASKAGMIGMTRTLSKELAKRKVTVNAVAPGFIESEMTKVLGESILKEVRKSIPANRIGTTEDVAAAVVFLASSAASYITGQVITVDGGMTG
jgi:3-oxoacyl-[acyl-carrier protein] reductase